MTVTYDLSTSLGKVRLKIGDNVVADTQFSDEELQAFLDEASSNILLASALALESWANSYAANATSENIGGYVYTQKVVDNMLKTAARYRDNDASTPYWTYAEMDLAAIGDHEL